MSSIFETIADYFKHYNWDYIETDDPNTYLTGFRDRNDRNFSIVVETSEEFITFTMPYGTFPDSVNGVEEELRTLLELNYQWAIAKLSLDANVVYVSLDVLSADFDYEHFEMALGMLAEAAEQLKTKVETLEPVEVEENESE